MSLLDRPANAEVLREADGELFIWDRDPDIVMTQLHGHLGDALMKRTIAAIDTRLASSPRQIFHDWSGYTGHAPAARASATQWSFRVRTRMRSLHILLPRPNKILAMAIAASNMVLGGFMQIHHDRATFEAALARAVRG